MRLPLNSFCRMHFGFYRFCAVCSALMGITTFWVRLALAPFGQSKDAIWTLSAVHDRFYLWLIMYGAITTLVSMVGVSIRTHEAAPFCARFGIIGYSIFALALISGTTITAAMERVTSRSSLFATDGASFAYQGYVVLMSVALAAGNLSYGLAMRRGDRFQRFVARCSWPGYR